MDKDVTKGPLKQRTLMLFALPEYAVYLASIPIGLYLPLVYSKDLGLSLTEIGLILMLARVSDVITDPLIGYLSDRTPGKFGRRKPWLAVGALLMMISAFQLFNPTVLNDLPITKWHLLTWAVLLWLGWTMINIPYYAWGAELSDDYYERTRITGWRQAFGFLGNVSVLAIPVTAGKLTGYGSLPQEGLTIIGSMALVALPVLISITLWKVPEREAYPRPSSDILKNARLMFKNGSFMLLFFGFMLMSLGTGWGSAVFMLFATYVVEAEGQTQAILLGYFGANILSLPVWVAVAQRIGKKQTWIIGGILFVVVTPTFLAIEPGDLTTFFICLAAYGVAGGNFGALSMSMKADVIEIAARRSNENIAGSYIAVWSLGQKMVAALALGMALPLLELLGFDPGGNNSPAEIQAVAYMYVLPPWLFYAIAVVVIWRYPISSTRLARIRSAFDRRDSRRSQ
ncbi:MAG: MFS transporter [Gammaproteobacteria bacterium]|jgi:glycoside/pentoside/hexuronide:cation symporter, GPH family|nr:MFS transporter [Gammaproteobacteria bacterium]MBT7372008.1 MFS transporter [Gammaproteobacteria bacterium]